MNKSLNYQRVSGDISKGTLEEVSEGVEEFLIESLGHFRINFNLIPVEIPGDILKKSLEKDLKESQGNSLFEKHLVEFL